MKTKIQFFGGVSGKLTGSSILLTIKEGSRTLKILFDIGLIQGGFTESLIRNREILKFLDPREITHIILTHSHIDHIGRLPLLVKNGFRGQIVCTKGSYNLLEVMLMDSAKIQVTESAHSNAKLNKGKNRRHINFNSLADNDYYQKKREKKEKKTTPLYTEAEVKETMYRIKNNGYDYHQWIKIDHNVHLKFYPSGHVMGGAIIVLRTQTKTGDYFYCFSGDLGRSDGIILPPPEIVKEKIDYLVIESTYGGKNHPPREQELQKLLELIKQVSKSKQKMIIPSFSLERTQEIIYLLSYYMNQKSIPKIPIYIVGPLSTKVTLIFADNWQSGAMFSDQNLLDFNPFDSQDNPYINLITTKKGSNELISANGAGIVIAGSGTCDAGMVRDYLKAYLGNPGSIICLVGYLPENSFGRRIKENKPLKMNGKSLEVRCQIQSFDSFSAHADGLDLVNYVRKTLPKTVKKIFIVHGETIGSFNLQNDLAKYFEKEKIVIPSINEEFILIE